MKLRTTRAAVSTAAVLTGAVLLTACGTPAPPVGAVTTVYNKTTGKLERLTFDRDGDGKVDTWAVMDGLRLQSLEIDRHGTGHPDRWEYYAEATAAAAARESAGSAFDRNTMLLRVEEANGPDGKTVTRREFYTDGVIARVEEDTKFNGHVDTWTFYDHGGLARIDIDMSGRGTADRRLVYRADGNLDRIEVDPTGTGHWVPAPADATGSASGKGGVQ